MKEKVKRYGREIVGRTGTQGKKMKRDKSNILRHELIGLEVEVLDAGHEGYKRINGKVKNETRNMLVILQDGEEKMVPKKNTVFGFKLNNDLVRVDGNRIMYRPGDRVKKARAKKARKR